MLRPPWAHGFIYLFIGACHRSHTGTALVRRLGAHLFIHLFRLVHTRTRARLCCGRRPDSAQIFGSELHIDRSILGPLFDNISSETSGFIKV